MSSSLSGHRLLDRGGLLVRQAAYPSGPPRSPWRRRASPCGRGGSTGPSRRRPRRAGRARSSGCRRSPRTGCSGRARPAGTRAAGAASRTCRPRRQVVELAGDLEDLVEVRVEDRLEAPSVRTAGQPGQPAPRSAGASGEDDEDEDDEERGRPRTPATMAPRYGATSALRSIGRSSGGGPSLAGAAPRGGTGRRPSGAILCRSAGPGSLRRQAARRSDPAGGPLADHGQARPRQHVPTRSAPTDPAPGRPPGRPAGTGRPGRSPRSSSLTDRRRGGARRRARGPDRGRGERRRGMPASGLTADARVRSPADLSPGPRTASSLSRPGRRRVRLRRARRPAHRARRWRADRPAARALGSSRRSTGTRDHLTPLAGPAARRATIGPCQPPGVRPAPDPRRSSIHRPSASRSPRGCARATSTSSSARSTSSASVDRSVAASPAATSPRSCCGVRRGPARRASPACWPTRSAPISSPCRRSCRASSRSAPRSPRPRTGWPCTARGRVLFLDEIHRFNKAQQDALLPHVEDGTVTLIGATTENPYFEVNAALLSRMRVWRLEALTDDEVGDRRPPRARRRGARPGRLARSGRRGRPQRRRLRAPRLARRRRRASGAQRPRGRDRPRRDEDIRDATATSARDSRTSRPPPSSASSPTTGPATATTTPCPRSSRACAATTRTRALYWLAAMIAAGEDPKFIARRLIISASEDVGNADPRALSDRRRRRPGARLDRAARGAVRAGPGDHLHRDGAEVGLARAGVWRGAGRRAQARVAQRPDAPARRRAIVG